jgi:hypothetical protein
MPTDALPMIAAMVGEATQLASPRALIWPAAVILLAAAAHATAEVSGTIAVMLGLVVTGAVPGLAVLRATRIDELLAVPEQLAVVPVAGLAAWVPALALAFALHLSLATATVAVVAVSTAVLAVVPGPAVSWRPALPAAAAGLFMAALVARVERPLSGDGLFHAGRVRKLMELHHLSVSGVSSYLDGHPHAGYGFPVLHAVEAAAISLTRLDPATGYVVLAPAAGIAVGMAAYGVGWRVAGVPGGVVAALLVAWDGLARPGETLSLVQQPPSFTTAVLYPALIILVLAWQRDSRDRRLSWAIVAATLVVTLTHPTYGIAAAGLVVGATALQRRGARTAAAATATVLVVAAGIWWFALHGAPRLPVHRSALATLTRFHHQPIALRGGTVVHGRFEPLAALVATPLLALAAGRRYLAAAGLAAVPLALVALPGVATALAPIVGPGQFRRMWFAIPWVMLTALALAVAVERLDRRHIPAVALALPLAAASIVVERMNGLWGWPMSTIVSLAAAVLLAIVAIGVIRGPGAPAFRVPRATLAPMLLLTLALAAGPLLRFGPNAEAALRHGPSANAGAGLPGPLVRALRARTATAPEVVLASPALAYRMVAEADLYAVALPLPRSRADIRNHPLARVEAVHRFFSPRTTPAQRAAILHRFRVDLVVARGAGARLASLTPGVRLATRAGGYVVLRVR